MVIADASGLPLAVHRDSARPHEVTLVQATLNEIVTVGQPGRIIGDRAYDSDPLDNALAAQGIEMIAPHRRNRKRKATQDWSPLAAIPPPLENRTLFRFAEYIQTNHGTMGQVS